MRVVSRRSNPYKTETSVNLLSLFLEPTQNIETAQSVIDVKDQMTFKVMLVIQWSLAPRWGAIQIPRKKGVSKECLNHG